MPVDPFNENDTNEAILGLLSEEIMWRYLNKKTVLRLLV